MSRPLRIDIAGGYYHVTTRGVAQQEIFFEDEDREAFLELLRQVHERYGLRFHGYCLMTNHYHLETETTEPNLSRAMQWLNQKYAGYVNGRYDRVGHLFQGRFKSVLAEAESYLHLLTRYIHLNPVRAGLVSHPGDYRWSSYRVYLGLCPKPAWLEVERTLCRFPGTRGEQRRAHRRFVEDVPGGNPLRELAFGAVVGTEHFVAWAREKLRGRKEDAEVARLATARARPSLDAICRAVGGEYGVEVSDLLVKGRKRYESRDVGVHLARELSGLSLKAIGHYFGGMGPSGVSMAHKRVARKLAKRRSALAKRVRRLSDQLTLDQSREAEGVRDSE